MAQLQSLMTNAMCGENLMEKMKTEAAQAQEVATPTQTLKTVAQKVTVTLNLDQDLSLKVVQILMIVLTHAVKMAHAGHAQTTNMMKLWVERQTTTATEHLKFP